MKASLKLLALGLFLLVPFATAYAQAPSLSTIPDVALNAGGTATVNVVAVDAGGRPITLTSALPSFAILNTPTFGTGVVVTTLTLTPLGVNVGTYTAAVTATAGGVADTRLFQITVNGAGSNQPPVVITPALRDVTVGSNLTFTVSASDADADAIELLNASFLPAGAAFTANASNTLGTFSWSPVAADAGEYDVVFRASNALSGAAVTHISVASLPSLAITPIGDVTVAGGSSISVPVIATGLPGATVTLTASLPSFATLNPPGTGTGGVNTTITVSPPTGSAGTYHASVTATSLGVSVTDNFDIIVTGSSGGENHAPALTAPASATVAVGSNLAFDVTATDADGDHVNLFGSGLPPGSTFLDHADNSGTFSWSPVAGQAGTYTASFSGLDGRGGSGSASTVITVTGGVVENHPPTLSAPLTQQVNEGANLTFTVTATDQDGDHVTLSANSVPSGAAFTDLGTNTGSFSWTPSFAQSGVYTVAFDGNDGHGGTGTASTVITVTDVVQNHAPVLSAPLTEQVTEGVNLTFAVTATDQDGDHVALSAVLLPTGATFSDLGNNTGTFSWTPGSTQSGVYNVAFTGNDGHGGTGTASTTITVMDVGGVGGGEVPGKACLVGEFKPANATTCFRIKPVNRSFDVSDVVLSSITLHFHGASIAAPSDGVRIEVVCPPTDGGHDGNGDGEGHDGNGGNGGNGGEGHDGQGQNGQGDDTKGHGDKGHDNKGHGNKGHDGASLHLGGDHPGEGDGDDNDDDDNASCGVSCNDSGESENGGACDTLGIRACFSTQAVVALFAGATLPCDLLHAEIHATLTNGATVVATFGGGTGEGDDDDKDKKDKDKHPGDDRDAIDNGRHGINPKVAPNPLNPQAELSFTMSREGRVRVTVYSMQGRLVKTLLNEYRAAGTQKLVWDGSNTQSQKVASGVYFFRIQAPEGEITHKVAVVK